MTPEQLSAHYQLGFSFDIEGNKTKAGPEYDLVIENATDDPKLQYKAYKAKLNLNFDNVEVRNNITAIMTELFSKNEELMEGLYYDLSIFHKATGDHNRFINNLEQLVSKFPNGTHYADALFELGLAYQHINKEIGLAIKTFITYFNKVGKKHNGIEVAALNLSECYNLVGKPTEARAILKKYLKIG
jgi:tetratricopeptide (TPR) repeat protein